MLTRNLGLVVLLLFAVVGHSQLLDLALGPPQQRPSPLKELGFAFIFAPIALVMLGEWIAQDSETAAWRRRGYLLAVVGGVWHLLLDAACLALPWLDVSSPWFSIAGALLGAVVMGLVVRASWRGLVTPFAEPPDLSQPLPQQASLFARLSREAALWGGTAIALTLISLGFVAMALFAVLSRPQANLTSLLGAGLFFGLCAAVGVWMGMERRAMLLGQPSPLSRYRPKFLQRAVVLPVREGLAIIDRKGATVYPWQSLANVALGELYNNSALLVTLTEKPGVWRYFAVPSEAENIVFTSRWKQKEARSRSISRGLTGVDLGILSVMTQDGPGVLAKQLREVLDNASALENLPTAKEAFDARKK